MSLRSWNSVNHYLNFFVVFNFYINFPELSLNVIRELSLYIFVLSLVSENFLKRCEQYRIILKSILCPSFSVFCLIKKLRCLASQQLRPFHLQSRMLCWNLLNSILLGEPKSCFAWARYFSDYFDACFRILVPLAAFISETFLAYFSISGIQWGMRVYIPFLWSSTVNASVKII